MCTTGDKAHIDMIFKLLPHTRQHVDNNLNIVSMCAVLPVVHTWNISSCQKKNFFQFPCGCEQFHSGRSFGFLVIGKAVPLQAWSGPECSRKLRFPDFTTAAQDGGKFISLTHRSPLPPRKYTWYSFLLDAESTPGP